MKQLVIRNGEPVLEEFVAPAPRRGWLLVTNAFSCVSVGTEVAALGSPVQKAATDPKRRSQVVGLLRSQGIVRTIQVAREKLNDALPIGYSSAGIVIDSGGIEGIAAGSSVACAGAGWASHAEVISVPRNLAVPVPPGVSLEAASTVAIGAIALQGVRRADLRLGETAFVIGLGAIGQITAQLLNAAGVRVVGLDLNEERVRIARETGVEAATSDAAVALGLIASMTAGVGADSVIITAASKSDEILSTACAAARRKGRVVIVGDVGLRLRRQDIYAKELDVLISASYGPGRYDPSYEINGQDYPLPYVRWTEGRNMSAYLELIARGQIRLDKLGIERVGLADAPDMYRSMDSSATRGLVPLIQYPSFAGSGSSASQTKLELSPKLREKHTTGGIRLGVVGAGSFVRGIHLPNVRRLASAFQPEVVATVGGKSAVAVGKRFGFRLATSDAAEVFQSDEVDAVLIGTRHDTHADFVARALSAGKHVFVEKPLCVNRQELQSLRQLRAEGFTSEPVLFVGFNRRYSPSLQHLRQLIEERSEPLLINYRVNSPAPELSHWSISEEGGGKNIGEACHMYDVFTFLTGAEFTSIQCVPVHGSVGLGRIKGNFVASVSYAEGSAATLVYTTQGGRSLPKEYLEVSVDGRTYVVNDYQDLTVFDNRGRRRKKLKGKGHLEELEAFAAAIKGTPSPYRLPEDWEIFQATEVALAVDDELANAF